MEEQNKQTSSEDVEAHHLGRLHEEPGTPDEHGRSNLVESSDDDVEAHHLGRLHEEPGDDDDAANFRGR